MCSQTCIDCFLEDWCSCWCADALRQSCRLGREDSEGESVMVRRYVDGRAVTTIETRPRRRSRSAANRGNVMTAPLPYGVTRTTGNTNAEDSNRDRSGRGGRQEGTSSNQNGGGRNDDDRPARGGNQGKDVGVQTTDSLLNLGAGASASGSGNQQDNQGKGKGKNKKNNNQDNNQKNDNQDKKQDSNQENSNKGSNKDKDQESSNSNQQKTGGKKNKNKKKEKSNQDSDPQEESSKVNDKSDGTKDKTKDKGKGKAKDDSKPQDSGTNNKKNVHFSENENKEKETEPEQSGGTSEWPAADEAPSEWETNTGDDSATAANEAPGWDNITGDSATAANEATSEWNNEATEIANIDCKKSNFRTKDRNPNTRQGRTRRRTRSNSRARSLSYQENERNTRPLSCKPVRGMDREYKHWACDSEGRFSLKSRAKIEEHYQPGEWEEDQGGRYEYFRSYTGW